MRVLVLEDTQRKTAEICGVLKAAGVNEEHIEIVIDATTAKRLLRKEYFDLAVIDIAVPLKPDGSIQRDAGMHLAEQMFNDPDLHCPMHVFGLTAFPDLARGERQQGLPASVFSVQLFDDDAYEWKRALQIRVNQIEAVRKEIAECGSEFRTELAIVCALDQPELRSVLDLPWNWRDGIVSGDPTIYREGSFVRRGIAHKVAAAAAPRMGLTAAAVTAAKIIGAYRPRYLAMVGIAAGVPERASFGDVIAADPVWDWGSGKWTLKKSDLKFLPAPHQINVEPRIRSLFRKLAGDTAALSHIKGEFAGSTPREELRVLVGPLASGASVLADGVTVARIIEEQHRELLGVDMEAYGVVAAALESSLPRPTAFILKSVVDYASPKKNDGFQQYGAYTSAAVLALFVQNYL